MNELESRLNELLNSPEQMQKIMEMAQAFTASSPETAAQESAPAAVSPSLEFDPRILRVLSALLSQSCEAEKEKLAILNALQPFLREDRREKLRQAVELARMARIARTALARLAGGDSDFQSIPDRERSL